MGREPEVVTELLNLRLLGFRRSLADRWWRRRGGARAGTRSCLGEKIRGMATSLSEWNVNVLGNLEKRLRKAKELEGWRREPIGDVSVGREVVWSFKMDRLEEQIDMY
jgi:hypothetical protein